MQFPLCCSGSAGAAADIRRSATEAAAIAATGLPALLPAHWSTAAGVQATTAATGKPRATILSP